MSQFKNFVSSHVHIDSLDSASTPQDFLKRELELNTGALVCTDHGFMGACREVYKLAKKNKIIPILGIEAYHRDDNCSILKDAGITNIKEYYKYGHFLAHAKDQKAYEALGKKVSDRDLTAEAHGSERKPIFTWNDIEELAQYNMTFSSGCLVGVVSRHLMSDRPDLAKAYYEKMRGIVGKDKFLVEMFPHKCDKNWVSGVFITFEDGSTNKYYMGKKIRTKEFDDITVADFAKVFDQHPNSVLLGVKNNHTWEPMEKKISKVVMIRDFIDNECRPWCPNGDVQLGANKFILELAQKHGDMIIISDDAHYASSELKIVQEAKLGGMGDNFKFYGDYHRQSSDEAFHYFKNNMGWTEAEFQRAVENSYEWRDQFKDFTLDQPVSLPKSSYPSDTKKYLEELIDKHGRRVSEPAYEARLAEEIKLLADNGTIDLLPYFFLAEDICDEYSRQKRLSGPGRGSAAGVLINYYLEITHVDPIKHKLSLDRFLTIDRIATGKLPDIDLDFGDNKILVGPDGYLRKKFGAKFAQISTKGLLRVKSSIKDVARSRYGIVPPDIEKVCSQIPQTPQGVEDSDFLFGYKSEDEKEVPGFFEQSEALQYYAQKYPDQWDLVQRMLAIRRSTGRHASGYLIADKPLDSFMPIMTVGGVRSTQYTATGCEESGAIKIDLLNVNSLKDLENCIAIVQKTQNYNPTSDFEIIDGKKVPTHRVIPWDNKLVDVYDLPELKQVFEEIENARTETVFQLDTNSARKGLRSFNIFDTKEDGAAFIALDRPGPLDALVTDPSGKSRNMLEEYAARRRGSDPYGSIDFLNNILPDTYGIIIYQESLTKVYRELTGCSGVDAENFRGIISKKKMKEVQAKHPYFIENASAKVGKEVAQIIWDQIVTFGQYGFNLSHAMSYFYVSYATLFLKKFFPLEWWCAVLQNAKKDEIFEKFWVHCKDMIMLPDVRYSTGNFYIKEDQIIAPLTMIKGLGDMAQKEIEKNSPFIDLTDFCSKIANTKNSNTVFDTESGKIKAGRSALNSGIVNKLIIAGVMDSMFPTTNDLIDKLEIYQKELATALGKKRPEKVKEGVKITDPLCIYQYRKKLLQIYSAYLPPLLYNRKVEGLNRVMMGNVPFYTYHPINDHAAISSVFYQMNTSKMFKPLPILTGPQFIQLNETATLAEHQVLRVAVAAYVESEESFSFPKKDKNKRATNVMLHAKKYNLDIDGTTKEIVKWPDWDTNKLHGVDEDLTGTIVIAVLSKKRENMPFKIDALIKVFDKFKETEK